MANLPKEHLAGVAGEVVTICQGMDATDMLWVLGYSLKFVLSLTAIPEQRDEWIRFTMSVAGIKPNESPTPDRSTE